MNDTPLESPSDEPTPPQAAATEAVPAVASTDAVAPETTVTSTPEVAVEAAEGAEAAEAAETAETAAAPVAELTPAAVAAKLKALFPALFTGAYKPLKLRIQADIQQRAPGVFTKAQLSAFLRRHTGSTGYLIALTKAKHRYDLDGQEAGEFAEEHRVAAVEELARRKGLQQERMAAEREQESLLIQQRRNRAGLLHDYERTTLTLANFCALKGVTPEELPGLLEIAKQERAEQPPRPQHHEARRDDRGGPRPGRPGGAGRGGRDDRPGRGGPRGEQPRKPQPPRG